MTFWGTVLVLLAGSAVWTPNARANDLLRLRGGTIALQATDAQDPRSLPGGAEPRARILKLAHAIGLAEQRILDGLGIRRLRYVPDDALIVQGTPEQLALAQAMLPGARLVAIRPEWKPSSGALAQYRTGGTRRYWLTTVDGAESALASPVELESLLRSERILAADLWPEVRSLEFAIAPEARTRGAGTDDPAQDDLSGTRLTGFGAARSRGLLGQGQSVAVCDSGLDRGTLEGLHADFTRSWEKGYASGVGTVSWEDPLGHGTHVAGLVTGDGTLSQGRFQGGAPGARLHVESIFSPTFGGLNPGKSGAPLLDPVFEAGVRVQNNSWGNTRNVGIYDSFAEKYDEWLWAHPELLAVFAAGNSGDDHDQDGRVDEGSINSPATAKNVLTVGASESQVRSGGVQKKISELGGDSAERWPVEPLRSDLLSDNPDGIAVFSSRGPTADGRLKPELVAPGTNLVSARSRHPDAGTLWGEFSADYLWGGGTSMSAPLVSAAAVLVRQELLASRGMDAPSAALVRAILMHTAHDLYPGQFGTGRYQELPVPRPNVHEGYGRLDVDRATRLDGLRLLDERDGLATGEEKSFSVRVGSSRSLRATLAYTDAPGTILAETALVNDLDLLVTGPFGFVRRLSDRRNNSEMLELRGLSAGTYEIRVVGVNVPMGRDGRQPYALVISAEGPESSGP